MIIAPTEHRLKERPVSNPGSTRTRPLPPSLDPRGKRPRYTPATERALIALGVLILAGAVLGVVLGLALGSALGSVLPRGDGNNSAGQASVPASARPTPPAPPAATGPIRPVAIYSYDPLGDDDGDAGTARTIDSDPATAWQTERYKTANFGGLKDGLGLMLDLGSARRVSSVALTLEKAGASVQLRPAPAADAGPNDLPVAAEARDAGEGVTLTPRTPLTTRYLAVWFTELPRVSGGYRAVVSEIQVRG